MYFMTPFSAFQDEEIMKGWVQKGIDEWHLKRTQCKIEENYIGGVVRGGK